jgi:hypothetical protein
VLKIRLSLRKALSVDTKFVPVTLHTTHQAHHLDLQYLLPLDCLLISTLLGFSCCELVMLREIFFSLLTSLGSQRSKYDDEEDERPGVFGYVAEPPPASDISKTSSRQWEYSGVCSPLSIHFTASALTELRRQPRDRDGNS